MEKEIEAVKEAEGKVTASGDYKMVIKKAFDDSAKAGNILLITGSFYLLAEAKDFIDHL